MVELRILNFLFHCSWGNKLCVQLNNKVWKVKIYNAFSLQNVFGISVQFLKCPKLFPFQLFPIPIPIIPHPHPHYSPFPIPIPIISHPLVLPPSLHPPGPSRISQAVQEGF